MSTNICKLKIYRMDMRSDLQTKEEDEWVLILTICSTSLVVGCPMANLNYICKIQVQLPEIKGIHPTQIAS